MNWSEDFSRAYGHTVHLPAEKLVKIKALTKSFILYKRHVLARLRAEGVKIPSRAKRGKTLLETLLETSPEEVKPFLKSLIRTRERLLFLILPILERVGRLYLMTRLGVSERELEGLLVSGVFETTLIQAARQGIDRMEKVGIRLDFVLMALSRLVPELERERQMLRITAEKEVGPREVGEENVCFIFS